MCPPVVAPVAGQCRGQVSQCWSPGVPDLDCPGSSLCCYDGCANVCVAPAPAPVPAPVTIGPPLFVPPASLGLATPTSQRRYSVQEAEAAPPQRPRPTSYTAMRQQQTAMAGAGLVTSTVSSYNTPLRITARPVTLTPAPHTHSTPAPAPSTPPPPVLSYSTTPSSVMYSSTWSRWCR